MGSFKKRMIDTVQDEKAHIRLYNENPNEYKLHFQELSNQFPGSPVLKNIQENYIKLIKTETENANFITSNSITLCSVLIWAIILLAYCFIAIKIFEIDTIVFLRRYLLSTSIFGITVFYLVNKKRGILVYFMVFILASAGFFLISAPSKPVYSQISLIVEIHMPFYFWIIFGIAFVDQDLFSLSAWRNFFIYFAKFMLYILALAILYSLLYKLAIYAIELKDPHFFSGRYHLSDMILVYYIIIGTILFPFLSIYFLEKNFKPNNPLFLPLINVFIILAVGWLIFSFGFFNFNHLSFKREGAKIFCFDIGSVIGLIILKLFGVSTNEINIFQSLPTLSSLLHGH